MNKSNEENKKNTFKRIFTTVLLHMNISNLNEKEISTTSVHDLNWFLTNASVVQKCTQVVCSWQFPCAPLEDDNVQDMRNRPQSSSLVLFTARISWYRYLG